MKPPLRPPQCRYKKEVIHAYMDGSHHQTRPLRQSFLLALAVVGPPRPVLPSASNEGDLGIASGGWGKQPQHVHLPGNLFPEQKQHMYTHVYQCRASTMLDRSRFLGFSASATDASILEVLPSVFHNILPSNIVFKKHLFKSTCFDLVLV